MKQWLPPPQKPTATSRRHLCLLHLHSTLHSDIPIVGALTLSSKRAQRLRSTPCSPRCSHRSPREAQFTACPASHQGRLRCSAAATVFATSIATVMRPTPPGTGLIADALGSTDS